MSPVIWGYNNVQLSARGNCTIAGTISPVMGGGQREDDRGVGGEFLQIK